MANRQETQRMLDLTCAMWDDPQVYFYQDLNFAPEGVPSVFFVGPSSRQDILEYKWRAFAHHYVRKAGYTGVIYVPEPRNNDWSFKDTFPMKIVEWESVRVLACTLVMSYSFRHEVQLPGRMTSTENAFLAGMAYAAPEKFRDRFVICHPEGSWKASSEKHWVSGIGGIKSFTDLELTCQHVAARLQT